MKTKKILFAFVFSLILFLPFQVSSQEKDSLNYYKKLFSKHKNKDDLMKCFVFFEKNKENNLYKKNYSNVIYDLYYISEIQYKIGQLNECENTSIEALKILDIMESKGMDVSDRKSFYNRLAIIKRNFFEYDKAINYYTKTLKLVKEKGRVAMAHNNLGMTYRYLNRYNLAKLEFEISYTLNKELNSNKTNLSMSLDNLGFVQAMLNEKVGIDNMMEALKIRKRIGDPSIYESYKSLTEYYTYKKDTVKALLYAKLGYHAAKKVSWKPYIKKALEQLIALKAYEFSIEYKNFTLNEEKERYKSETKYAEAKYSVEKEKERTRMAESNMVKILFVAVVILLIAVFLYFYLKSRHKKEKLKKQFETEQRISKKLHDEVANDVYSMMSRLQNNPTTEKELIDDLEDVYLKTRDISKTNAALDVSQDFDELLKDLIASYKTADVNIFTRNISKVSWSSLTDLKKETLYRVIQELLTNMRKHSQASLVTLKFEEKNGRVSVFYIDDGIGCKLKYGNGLRNTENRMELAGGNITFESETNKGFHAKLRI